MMRSLFAALFFTMVFATSAQADGVRLGMTRAEVEAALGKPAAVLQRRGKEVLLYPRNGQIEFSDGKVVEMQNVPVAEEFVPAPPAQIPDSKPASAKPKPKPTTAIPEDGDIDGMLALPHAPALTKALTSAKNDADQSVKPRKEPDHSLAAVLIIGGFCRVLIMIIVLKLAFNWADVHADWAQMVTPSIADSVVRSLIVLSGNKLFGTTDLFYADEGIAYLALIFVLTKTTHACTLPRAIAVAGASKLMSIVVSSLIAVAILSKMAG